MSNFIRSIIVIALIAGASSLSASDPAPATTAAPAAATTTPPADKNAQKQAAKPAEAPPEPKTTATVITNEGWSERCILSTVVTEVDGKAVAAGDKTETFEFEPGEHSISGYGGVDPTKCATFIGDKAVKLTAGEHIGQSTLKFSVEADKTYYVGLDVRQPEKSTWQLVVWQIKH